MRMRAEAQPALLPASASNNDECHVIRDSCQRRPMDARDKRAREQTPVPPGSAEPSHAQPGSFRDSCQPARHKARDSYPSLFERTVLEVEFFLFRQLLPNARHATWLKSRPKLGLR